MLSRFIYHISTRSYFTGIRIASLWNAKARKWVAGRRNWQTPLQQFANSFNRPQHPLVWMHCSSLGEYEQGRPLLEAVKKAFPQVKTMVSFFSPSGYEVKKDDPLADYTCYLPADSAANARRFIELTNPQMVLWIKYEYWFHYLRQLKQQRIPVLLASAVFQERQPFFKWYNKLFVSMLQCFQQIFVQDEDSKKLLANIGVNHVSVAGDSRFDRVLQIAQNFEPLPLAASFCGEDPVIVAGSTWPEDEEELDHYANTNTGIKFIIAPHQVNEERIAEIEALFRHTTRYSQLAEGKPLPQPCNVLIIDNIGILSRLYNYATISYVGGGFGEDGVHNVLEAAVYGRPVVFGPEYEKYREAGELVDCEGAESIENALELEEHLNYLLSNHQEYIITCEAARKYVMANAGATQNLLAYIQTNRLLTSA
jgi:3-deoxy-D-manno-octulosonic-acid transferase